MTVDHDRTVYVVPGPGSRQRYHTDANCARMPAGRVHEYTLSNLPAHEQCLYCDPDHDIDVGESDFSYYEALKHAAEEGSP